jgi:hypothetical protein
MPADADKLCLSGIRRDVYNLLLRNHGFRRKPRLSDDEINRSPANLGIHIASLNPGSEASAVRPTMQRALCRAQSMESQ